MGRFDGKVGIVTGAGGGIGEGYAKRLAAEGASVAVADINTDGAERVASEITASGGKAIAVRVDVSDEASTKEMAEKTISEFGGIDYLVNNAAIFGAMEFDILVTVDWDYYQRFMNVNMNGALLCTRAVRDSMIARGGGSIVNQSSTAAYMYSGFYGLAKAGVNALTRQLARELGGNKIRINAVAPGPIDTEANRTVAGDASKDIIRQQAIRTQIEIDDLADTVLFLLSDEARTITGQVINVDGGHIFQ